MLALALCALAFPGALRAQPQPAWEMEALNDQGWAEFDFQSGLGHGTNGVLVRYGTAFLTANEVSVNQQSGEVTADGQVRIQSVEQIWVGEHIRYNFKTRQMEAEQFRTGKLPTFAEGVGLHGDTTNGVYIATNGVITSDDVAKPAVKVRAKYLKIIPGERVEAHHATVYVEGIPVFYFPYYSRSLAKDSNHLNFVPGYRSSFGPFLLSSYTFFLNDQLDGTAHLDYREKRGVGGGPDLNYRLGSWGEGTFKYYYMNDKDPGAGGDPTIANNRQRVYFAYQADPATNINVKALVRFQTDTNIIREFFEGEYLQDPQPSTYVEATKYGQNFSLDTYVQPRVNNFLETVERLPDVRLTGYRQELGTSPVYYQSESTVGYYRRLFADTNSVPTAPNYEAARVDTYHQLLLPETFFGWLNVTPRVGGRFTYYSTATGPGARTDDVNRGVFDTGAEVSTKISRLWPGAESDFFDADGLRHIITPSIGYTYVPAPNAYGTNEIPQFDYQLPSLRLLPNNFPDYNSIDSIMPDNSFRFGVHNKLETKREGNVVSLVDWNVYGDWNVKPNTNQTTYSDLYSDLTVNPWSWLTLESQVRYDVPDGFFRMSVTTLSFHPQKSWRWTVGQVYLRSDLSTSPIALGPGDNLYTSSVLLHLNENWGLRATHWFDAETGVMREQDYSIYRDFRSWTGALTFMVRKNPGQAQDFTVAFTFWLKSFPQAGLGQEMGHAYY
jgi:lipopolysaccharide assembly outer membrane protein LptD (OstA)